MDSQQRTRCFVNASVALKWHLPQEPFAQQALEFLADWQRGAMDLLTPDIFFAEIAHALVRAVRRGRLSVAEATTILADLLAMPIQLLPTMPLVQRAAVSCDCRASERVLMACKP